MTSTLSWKFVLYPHWRVGDRNNMKHMAATLEYPYFWWNGAVYNTKTLERTEHEVAEQNKEADNPSVADRFPSTDCEYTTVGDLAKITTFSDLIEREKRTMSIERTITILKDRIDDSTCDGECNTKKPCTRCVGCEAGAVLNEIGVIVRSAL